MTTEHHLLVGLADIVGVALVCKKCSARVTIAPEKIVVDDLGRCPMCEHQWLDFSGKPKHGSPTALLLSALSKAGDAQETAADGVRILFVVNESAK